MGPRFRGDDSLRIARALRLTIRAIGSARQLIPANRTFCPWSSAS
jgi:hypothetical protein